MNAGKGDAVMVADARIAALTGQTFSQAYVDNIVKSDTEVLASNLTAQAAALVHDQGAAKEFAVRHRLETARYVDGTSAADRDAVIAALIAEGVQPEVAQTIGTPELAARAEAAAQRAAAVIDAVGSQGVPTILEVQGDGFRVVDHSAYYRKPAAIAA